MWHWPKCSILYLIELLCRSQHRPVTVFVEIQLSLCCSDPDGEHCVCSLTQMWNSICLLTQMWSTVLFSGTVYLCRNLYMTHCICSVTQMQIFPHSHSVIFWFLCSHRDPNTLFRGNSLLSKMVDELMKLVGLPYLHDTLKVFIDSVSHNRLVGLVVKASASRAGGPGFESR